MMGDKRADQDDRSESEQKPGARPSERAIREKRDRDDQARRGNQPDADDERVDEASRESFPASDPPSIP
jgi:hypothetical protein